MSRQQVQTLAPILPFQLYFRVEFLFLTPAQVEGTQDFLPQPEKDLERPSTTRLEARFPYHDSRKMTRSPSPLAWRLQILLN